MPCIIGTAGHIDHGKTTLVKALTGIETDTLAEEKKRGVSIELGFAYMELGGGARAAIVDVPGHERFIRNMLAGTTGIDMVLFCIAADDGIMPQTLEHLEIVSLLSVRRALFAITKADTVTDERLSEVEKDTRDLLKETPFESSPVVAVSASSGAGMDELKMELERLCSEASSSQASGEAGRDVGARLLRLPIDRAFSIKGFGTVVTGTVASGSIARGDELNLLGRGRTAGSGAIGDTRLRVRGIESHHEKVEEAGAGVRAAVNISGVQSGEINRGDTLVSSELGAELKRCGSAGVSVIDCRLEFLSSMNSPFKSGKNLALYHLTSETGARVQIIGIREAAPGERLFARLRLNAPVMALRGDRFILRDPSLNRTVGGGEVLMVYPVMGRLTRASRVDYDALDSDGEGTVLLSLLKTHSLAIETTTASLMLNVTAERLSKILSSDDFVELGKYVMAASLYKTLKTNVIETLKQYHGQHPGDVGLKIDKLAESACKTVEASRKECEALTRGLVLDSLVDAGKLVKKGSLAALASFSPAATGLGGADAEVEKAIVSAVGEGFKTIKAEELRSLPFKRADIDRVIEYLTKRSVIVKLKPGLFISGKAIEVAKSKLVDYFKTHDTIKAAEFRDRLGTGRKMAIEILEYFDKERITLRKGDERSLR